MKTVIILMGPGQLDDLIADLHTAQITPETESVALILSEEPIQTCSEGLMFLREGSVYTGPIYTLGFRGSPKEVRQHLHNREKLN